MHFFNKLVIFLLLVSIQLFADVGYFIGSFDPPTLAHKESVLKAMEVHDLEKVYITVNHNTAKDYLTSVDERIEMLRLLFKDHIDSVFILREPLEGRVNFAEEVLKNHQDQKVFGIFGDDTFEKNFSIFKGLPNFDFIKISRPEFAIDIEALNRLPSKEDRRYVPTIYDLEISGTGISSSKARDLIKEGDTVGLKEFLDLDIIHSIMQRELYKDTFLSEKNLFLERFHSLLDELQQRMPEINDVPEPEFKPTQSFAAQSEKFIRQIVEAKNMDLEDQFIFRPLAEEILNIPSRSEPFHAFLKVGYFPGSFDFLSPAQIEVIKKAQEQLQLDRVYVVVLETSNKQIEHTLEERIAHAKELLGGFGNKIKIISAPSLDKLKDVTETLTQEYVSPSFMILGANVFESNYNRLKSIHNLKFAVATFTDNEDSFPEEVVILKP